MVSYIVRRLGQAVIVVLVVTIIVFVLIHSLPGGAARAILGMHATPARVEAFNVANGLNKPLAVQYFTSLTHWLTGDFGYSYKLNQSVSSLLAERLPKTLILSLLALVVTVIAAIPIGVYQAVRRNRAFDYTATLFSFVLYAAPIFFIGLILIGVFASTLGWLPPEAPQADGVGPIFQAFPAMILPILTLALGDIAGFSRYMRSSVLDNLTQDYVRTAQANGASPARVLYGHVLRNAMIPIITLLGVTIPFLFAGALIVESIFNFPGMGLLFWQAAQRSDYPIEIGVVIVTAFATVAGNLLADLALLMVDPRVKI